MLRSKRSFDAKGLYNAADLVWTDARRLRLIAKSVQRKRSVRGVDYAVIMLGDRSAVSDIDDRRRVFFYIFPALFGVLINFIVKSVSVQISFDPRVRIPPTLRLA